jgi:4-diphosphocytidyl-2-C-methyl-D-erythritol kinase
VSLRISAPAKVNLSLRVLGRRPDGFHEIRTLFQALDLGDELRVSRGARGISLEVRGPDLGPTEENLAYRAAEIFLEAFGETQGVHIELTKWIPAGAGMGGGSSDAAAVLRALSWLSPFPPPPGELMRLGAKLGSDVPFFLGASPLAKGTGRGENLTPYRALPAADLVLALPGVHMSTAEAYGAEAHGSRKPKPKQAKGGTGPPSVRPRPPGAARTPHPTGGRYWPGW